ncbi:MAG: hypothetical protein LBV72_09860 [Tannerella sp.]|jgi:transcription antitermination factor NusG|nr:hypothetical protein [Tannerella sp.]
MLNRTYKRRDAFPSYVFVKMEEQLRTEVFGVPGVVKFVTFEGKPSVLNERER